MDKEKILRLCDEIENDLSDAWNSGTIEYELAGHIVSFAKKIAAEITAPPKSNGDIYDLLCDMNANFMNGNPHCVLEAITGANMICKHESCNHCIAEWLKQEVIPKCGARMDGGADNDSTRTD